MIEILVRSKDITLQTSHIESLSHPRVVPVDQMRAAAQASWIRRMLSYERGKIQEIKEFAKGIEEQVVIWDLSTLKGKDKGIEAQNQENPLLDFLGQRGKHMI